MTTNPTGDSAYISVEGTSYACPLTAGVAAMIWSARPNLSPNDVELLLKGGADDIGTPGLDDFFGYGRLNLKRSLQMPGITQPVAAFAGYLTSGASPLPVKFTSLSTGVPSIWL